MTATAATSRRRSRSMGVDVELLSTSTETAATAAFAAIEQELARLNAVFSRFDESSELSQLNRRGRARVGPELAWLAAHALDARRMTDGLVDVTVHDAVVAWGYDRTFAEVAGRDNPPPGHRPRCGGSFHVDAATGTITLGPATRLDFGGLAKGYAVDRALAILSRAGNAVVNLGGDLAVAAADEAPWSIGVETPDGGLTLALAGGALATSGRDARRWRAGGREVHHLIDPRTGAPSESDLLRATAWAPTALEAEVRAKQLFLLGCEAAVALAERERIPCVLVTTAGRTLLQGGLA